MRTVLAGRPPVIRGSKVMIQGGQFLSSTLIKNLVQIKTFYFKSWKERHASQQDHDSIILLHALYQDSLPQLG